MYHFGDRDDSTFELALMPCARGTGQLSAQMICPNSEPFHAAFAAAMPTPNHKAG
jgi:hypothetical protein